MEGSMSISIGEELERRFLLQEKYLRDCKPVNRIDPFEDKSLWEVVDQLMTTFLNRGLRKPLNI